MRRAALWAVALGLVSQVGCKASLHRSLARGDLEAVQRVAPEKRARMSARQSSRYAELLYQNGQSLEAELWWLGAYLRGANLSALESLAQAEALRGAYGFAASHFAEVVATTRGELEDKALACRMWDTRMWARYQVRDFVGARKDQLRLSRLCSEAFQNAPAELEARATQASRARALRPELIYTFPAALTPSFMNSAWRAQRMGVPEDLDPGPVLRPHEASLESHRATSPAAQILSALVDPGQSELHVERWLAKTSWSHEPRSARLLLDAASQDPTLGAASAGWTALLASVGQTRALEIMQDKLRASSSLISAPSARLRVILALGLQDREQANFWMRVGASQMADLGQWWLWCVRWAELMNQRDAARVAHQALAPLVAPGSPARWVLSWWRLRQRVLDLRYDPYMQSDAPNLAALQSVRSLWEQFVRSLPSRMRSSVWPTLTDELALRGWSPQEMERAGMVVLGPGQGGSWRREITVSSIQARAIERDPAAYSESPSLTQRRAAWRKLWSARDMGQDSLTRLWGGLLQDPALSPRVDPLAALSVLFSSRLDKAAENESGPK